tara:strand:+ start:2385 stop:3074 length:690 start_codon:yes stop_codon:yes gene_type:complete
MKKNVLIVGAGNGLSASLTHLFITKGFNTILACRNINKIQKLCNDTGAHPFCCDVSNKKEVDALFSYIDEEFKTIDIVVYNAGIYERGSIIQVSEQAVKTSLMTNAYGAFLIAQEASKRMINAGQGSMLFTGASAGVKGYAKSAPFAMGKFALRGLCQSLARELAPQNIHVAHFVIDGLIYSENRGDHYNNPITTLDPNAIAKTYYQIAIQDKSAWTWEIELRPSTEIF